MESAEERLFKLIKEGKKKAEGDTLPAPAVQGASPMVLPAAPAVAPVPVVLRAPAPVAASEPPPVVAREPARMIEAQKEAIAVADVTAKLHEAEHVPAEPETGLEKDKPSWRDWMAKLSFVWMGFQTIGGVQWPQIETLNKVLAIVLAVLTMLVFANALMGRPNIATVAAKLSTVASQSRAPRPVKALEPSAVYLQAARSRNIFGPVSDNPKKGNTSNVQAVMPDFQQATKDLVLVGMCFGDDPEAMIEDKSAKKTYFIKRGGTINGLKVKQIESDRVVLDFEGYEQELR